MYCSRSALPIYGISYDSTLAQANLVLSSRVRPVVECRMCKAVPIRVQKE